MKLVKRAIIPALCILILISVWAFHGAGAARAARPQAKCSPWTVVSSPNPGAQNIFDGVTAISASDIWAVGYTDSEPLTAHWDGSSWSVIPNPTLSGQNLLVSVSAIATNNVWAVGQGNGSLPLTENWNGSIWSVVSAPLPGGSGYFFSVAAIPGTNEAWAVGYYQSSRNVSRTLIELWNGSAWNVVNSPNASGAGNRLLSVAAGSSTDAWAVGNYKDSSSALQQLTEHWDGTSWSVVSSPIIGRFSTLWSAAQIPTSSDYFAVGTSTKQGSPAHNLTEAWDGTSWDVDQNQNVSGVNNTLFGVTALSSTNAWAVGLVYTNGGANQALAEHWNGDRWSNYFIPNVMDDSILTGVTTVPATKTVWAVGVSYDGQGGDYTVTEEFCA
jgi:hypothetical protein